MYKLSSCFIGILIAIMIAINGTLSKYLGNYLSTVVIHLIGLLCIILVLVIKKIKFKFHRDIPIFLYSAGAIGVFTVLFNNIGFNYLGASLTLSLGLLGQSITSIIVDNYGVLGMKASKLKKEKLIGLIIISLGIVIMTLY